MPHCISRLMNKLIMLFSSEFVPKYDVLSILCMIALHFYWMSHFLCESIAYRLMTYFFLCRYCCAGSLALRFIFMLRLSWSSGQCCLATFSSSSQAFAFQAMPLFYSLPYIDRSAHGFFYRFYSCAQVVLAVLAREGQNCGSSEGERTRSHRAQAELSSATQKILFIYFLLLVGFNRRWRRYKCVLILYWPQRMAQSSVDSFL